MKISISAGAVGLSDVRKELCYKALIAAVKNAQVSLGDSGRVSVYVGGMVVKPLDVFGGIIKPLVTLKVLKKTSVTPSMVDTAFDGCAANVQQPFSAYEVDGQLALVIQQYNFGEHYGYILSIRHGLFQSIQRFKKADLQTNK